MECAILQDYKLALLALVVTESFTISYWCKGITIWNSHYKNSIAILKTLILS